MVKRKTDMSRTPGPITQFRPIGPIASLKRRKLAVEADETAKPAARRLPVAGKSPRPSRTQTAAPGPVQIPTNIQHMQVKPKPKLTHIAGKQPRSHITDKKPRTHIAAKKPRNVPRPARSVALRHSMFSELTKNRIWEPYRAATGTGAADNLEKKVGYSEAVEVFATEVEDEGLYDEEEEEEDRAGSDKGGDFEVEEVEVEGPAKVRANKAQGVQVYTLPKGSRTQIPFHNPQDFPLNLIEGLKEATISEMWLYFTDDTVTQATACLRNAPFDKMIIDDPALVFAFGLRQKPTKEAEPKLLIADPGFLEPWDSFCLVRSAKHSTAGHRVGVLRELKGAYQTFTKLRRCAHPETAPTLEEATDIATQHGRPAEEVFQELQAQWAQ